MTVPRRAVLQALVRRDYLITRSYRAALVLDVFFGAMNLIVFYFISRTVALRSGTLQGAPTYFAFASIGIILTVVMQATTTGLARRIREEQLAGTLEMLTVQPVSSVEMTMGLTGFPILYAVARTGLYVAFAAAFLNLDLSHADLLGFAATLTATALALSAIGIFLGGLVLVFKQGDALAAVITFGFGLLSGALFPRALLPGWLQPLGDVLPTRFALDGMRHALFGGDDWVRPFLAVSATAVVMIPASIVLFTYLLGVVKRTGSLSQY